MPYILDLKEKGKEILKALQENGLGLTVDSQMLMLAEEVGEVIGAYRRATGRARRTDTMEHVHEEVADVVIGAYVVAASMDFNLDEAILKKLATIFSRGWRENVDTA